MNAQGKETASQKAVRNAKEKLEHAELMKKISDEIDKKDQKQGRFDNILWMFNNHPLRKLEAMLGQSMIPAVGATDDQRFDILCAYTMSFFSKITKDIDKIKQCLNEKQDKFKPDTTLINPLKKEGSEDGY